MGGIFARKVEKVAQLCPIQSQYESRAHFGNFWPENDQKQKFGLRRGFFGPNQKVQKTKYVFTRPIHPPEVELNQNFEIGTLSPPSILAKLSLVWTVEDPLKFFRMCLQNFIVSAQLF